MISTSHFHPMLVHFPIVLILVGFLFEIASILYKKEIYLTTIAFYFVILGLLSAITALLSGALFTSEMSGAAGSVKETHELFAWITLTSLIVLSGFRIFLKLKNKEKSNLKWVAFVIYGLAAISVSITGFYGGTLVYNYMMPL